MPVPPFHYGTHYSSAAIVMNYLVRLQPFADAHVSLQQETFDYPDRIFQSISDAWASASGNLTDPLTGLSTGQQGTQDVRE